MTKVLHLPSIHGNATVAGEGHGEMNDRAQAFADAWFALLSPERQKLMRFDSRLAMCAQKHAEFLSQRTGSQLSESMHRGLNGSYSNQRVLEAGYKLPGGENGYSPYANNVESCSRDSRDPATVAIALSQHESHHDHMYGVNGFEDRTVWAVGCSGDDFVFLACPPESETN